MPNTQTLLNSPQPAAQNDARRFLSAIDTLAWCLLAAQDVNKQIHKILLMYTLYVENIMKVDDRSSSLKPFKEYPKNPRKCR